MYLMCPPECFAQRVTQGFKMSYSYCLMSPIGDHMCDGFLSDSRRKRGKGSKQCNQGNGVNTQITGCTQVVSFLQPPCAESPFASFTDVEPKSFDQVHQEREQVGKCPDPTLSSSPSQHLPPGL